jgi:hypothetical protein
VPPAARKSREHGESMQATARPVLYKIHLLCGDQWRGRDGPHVVWLRAAPARRQRAAAQGSWRASIRATSALVRPLTADCSGLDGPPGRLMSALGASGNFDQDSGCAPRLPYRPWLTTSSDRRHRVPHERRPSAHAGAVLSARAAYTATGDHRITHMMRARNS